MNNGGDQGWLSWFTWDLRGGEACIDVGGAVGAVVLAVVGNCSNGSNISGAQTARAKALRQKGA